MTDETYNGYKNRETWAFNLEWQNDEGIYHTLLDSAESWLMDNPEADDYSLGEYFISWLEEIARESIESQHESVREFWLNLLTDIGSFWRVDEEEVGAAIRESLYVEGRTPEVEED